MLGWSFEVDEHWLHRLARVKEDLDRDQNGINRLRRREPMDQALLCELDHHIKLGRFRESRG
jgi:hypothetical protein